MKHSMRALAALLVTSALSSPALAQDYAPPGIPPIRQTVDQFGVDLTRGTIAFAGNHSISIGPAGAAGMAWSRTVAGGTVFYDSTAIVINVNGSVYTVSVGGSSESFTLTGSNYVPGQGSGSTLVLSGSNYIYTTSDGTVYTLAPVVNNNKQYQGTYHGISVVRPTGEVETYNWETVSGICHWNAHIGTCTRANGQRLRSVTSTNGYNLAFTFQVEDPSSIDGPTPGWAAIATVQAQNMSVNPTTQSWPTLTFNGQTFINSSWTVTDSLSRTTTYRYAADGSGYYPTFASVQRPGASTPNELIGYNTSGLVSGVTLNGVTDSYGYSTVGTVFTTTVTDPNSNTRVVKSDNTTNLVSSDTNELGKTTTYTYYPTTGLLNTVTAPEGNYATYTYDQRGNLTQTTATPKSGSGLSPISTYASYPASDATNTWMCATGPTAVQCNKPTTTTDGNGNVTNYVWDSASGLPTSVTLPAPTTGGVRPQTRYTYASIYGQYLSGSSLVNFGTPVTRLSTTSQCQTTASCSGTSDEVKTTVNYTPTAPAHNPNVLPLGVSKGSGDGLLTATETFAYDPTNYGNVAYVTDPNGNTSRILYDADRELWGTISADPDGSGGPLPNIAVRYSYNNDGQVTKVENGTTLGQSDAQWAAFLSANEVDTAYDANARKTTDTLKSGSTSSALTQYGFDNMGRLQCIAVRMNTATYGSLPSSACSQGTAGSYGPDQITQISYSAASQPLTYQVAVGTASANTNATLTYSNNGLPKTLKDGMNNLTTNVYDGFDRLSQTQFPTKTPQGAGTSNTSDYILLGYDNNRNVTSQRNRDTTTITVSIDHLNRTTQKVVPTSASGVAGYTINYTYDLLNRPLTATFASGGLGITNTYDALSRQVTSSSNMDGTARTFTSTYDLAGNRTLLTGNIGGYSAPFSYDYLNRMTAYVGQVGITYDNLGNRSAVNSGTSSTTSSGTYGYSPVNWLTSLTIHPVGTGGDQSLTFTESPSAQIAMRGSSNDSYAYRNFTTASTNYTSNGLNQYTAVGSYGPTYDNNGNLITYGGDTYTYDDENKLVSVSGVHNATLYYDPSGRLWQITPSGGSSTRFIYDGLHDVVETTASGTVLRDFVWGPGPDDPLVRWEGGAQNYLHADERGSIVAAMDRSGNTLSTYSYDEYGNLGSSTPERFQYTGQAYLTEVGLYYYKSRFYHPGLGRFLQSDPIGTDGGINLYNYTGNDPVNLTDPLGLDPPVDPECNTRNLVICGKKPPCPTYQTCNNNPNGPGDPTAPPPPRLPVGHGRDEPPDFGSETHYLYRPAYCDGTIYKIASAIDTGGAYLQAGVLTGGVVGQAEPYAVVRAGFRRGAAALYEEIGVARFGANLVKAYYGDYGSSARTIVFNVVGKAVGGDQLLKALADFGIDVGSDAFIKGPCDAHR
jgi:RHS repeat-associated protein